MGGSRLHLSCHGDGGPVGSISPLEPEVSDKVLESFPGEVVVCDEAVQDDDKPHLKGEGRNDDTS